MRPLGGNEVYRRSGGWGPMMESVPLSEEILEKLLFLSLSSSSPLPNMWTHSEKMAICKPGGEFSSQPNYAGILVSVFQPSELQVINDCSLSPWSMVNCYNNLSRLRQEEKTNKQTKLKIKNSVKNYRHLCILLYTREVSLLLWILVSCPLKTNTFSHPHIPTTEDCHQKSESHQNKTHKHVAQCWALSKCSIKLIKVAN